MQVVCISRGSYDYGRQVAEKLSAVLGWPCVGREQVVDEATAAGIPVGKIEMAIVKRRPLSEALEVEISRFKAFVAEQLCAQAVRGSVVYHGRAGHLVLPGLPNVLRVRAIAGFETQVAMTMGRLRLTRERAKEFCERVEEDTHRWVRYLYNADWSDPASHDLTVNADKIPADDAARLLEPMVRLPAFQLTPAGQRTLEDIRLAARCRLAVGRDPRTRDMSVAISAEEGRVLVTYSPWLAGRAAAVEDVLRGVEGLRACTCSAAATNVAFIQERFRPDDEALGQLAEISGRWNAAVHVVCFAPGEAAGGAAAAAVPGAPAPAEEENHGGILSDTPDCGPLRPDGVPETMDRLVRAGLAGGFYHVAGGPQELADRLGPSRRFELMVVGDVFSGKVAAVRKRLKRDLIALLADRFKSPVIGTEDLRARYIAGTGRWLSLAAYAALTALLYLGVFGYEQPILELLRAPGFWARAGAAAAITLFVPLAAYTIGGLTHGLLSLLKFE